MTHRPDLRTVALALAFFAIGFLVAERMTPASAAAPAAPATIDNAQAFSGTSGTVIAEDAQKVPYVIIVRDTKIWRIQLGASSSAHRPWATLSE